MKYGILTFEDPVPDISRKIIHVDMDAFYASVEIRDNQTLHRKPVIIAKHPNLTNGRGIVTTCNYIARQYGVHSAMPSIEAYRLCPKGVFIPPRMHYYRKISHQIREIFYRYTDLVEPLSLDEAYLDVTHNKLNIPYATDIAKQIQRAIYEELQLTCSVGVSYNKFIAKVASDYHKPNGLTIIKPEQSLLFLSELPIERFYGVGSKTVAQLHALGIYNGADLLQVDLETLVKNFGKMGYSLYHKARGIHSSPVEPHRPTKSIGRETTFRVLIEQEEDVMDILRGLATEVIEQMQAKELVGQTLSVKVRYDTFETVTRQVHTSTPISTVDECMVLVEQLWDKHHLGQNPIRLLGLSISQLLNYWSEKLPV